MAEIIEQEKGQKGGKRRPKKGAARVDMTPMVDLMCLLITFFMLTTAFSKPKVMEITMPDKNDPKKDPGTKIAAARTYHILLSGDDKIYWYNGLIEKGKPVPELHKTTYGKDGIRKILLQRNKIVFKKIADLKERVLTGKEPLADSVLNRKIREIKKNADKNAPIILIKADDKAKYRNIVDIIDEMAICNIGAYVVVDLAPEEVKLIKSLK